MPEGRRRRKWLGVEPTMFLYMSAFMITSVVEEDFFIHKSCLVNSGFPKNICDNISAPQNKDYLKEVQKEVAIFHQYESIASHAVPIVLAFFLGAWSDQVGRKLPLLLGLVGNLIYSLMIVVNAYQVSWPVEVIIFSASLPCAITGGSLTVFMAAFSYLADTTTPEERTLRATLYEVAYLIPMPIGVAVGSYLFNHVVHRSHAIMFLINSGFLVLSIIYTWIFLEWQTVETQTPQRDKCCCGLFNFKHMVESIKTIIKPRVENRRMYLILTLLAMALYTFQRDEKHLAYYYTQLKFHWGVSDYSKFRTFQSSFFIVGLLIGAPILGKVLGVKDSFILMIGAISHTAARIIFIAAQAPWLFYLGAFIACLGPIVAPVLRSITSKLVPSSERGKVFAIFTVADTTVPVVSGIVYNQIYHYTINTFPASVFVVTAVTQIFVLFFAIFFHIMLKGENVAAAQENDEESAAFT